MLLIFCISLWHIPRTSQMVTGHCHAESLIVMIVCQLVQIYFHSQVFPFSDEKDVDKIVGDVI